MSTNKNLPRSALKAAKIESRSQTASQVKQDLLAEETPVAMVYNGISHAVMMASPSDLEDFARGFSLTEGIIKRHKDILDIDAVESHLGIELRIELLASRLANLKEKRRQLAGRTGCGLCGIDSLAALEPELKTVQRGPLPAFDAVQRAINSMQTLQQLQQQCGAVHGAALADKNGQVLKLREDVGRHNALDKLIGSLEEPVAPEHFLLISSRASYEMILKAAAINSSTLVAISAPTSFALEKVSTSGYESGGICTWRTTTCLSSTSDIKTKESIETWNIYDESFRLNKPGVVATPLK